MNKLVMPAAAAAIAALLALGGFTVCRQELRHARPVEVIPLFGVTGPESLAFDADGEGPYTGVSDGRILKWESENLMWVDFAASHGHLEFMSAIISGDKTGRMMVYDPMREEVHVLLDGLSFPNGLAISHDNSFILVAESTTCRILKYQLGTPSSKRFEVFTELPGFPDNIKRSPRGGYWVALHSKRRRILKWLLSQPWFGEVLLRIPFDVQRFGSFISSFSGQAMAIRLGEDGEVLEVLEGLGGRKIRFISEVEEHNGILWLGSFLNPFVGLYKLHL